MLKLLYNKNTQNPSRFLTLFTTRLEGDKLPRREHQVCIYLQILHYLMAHRHESHKTFRSGLMFKDKST